MSEPSARRLSVGLIGCGRMGRKRSAALAPDRLTACHDVDQEAAEALAEETGAKAYESVDELLATRPDAVIVSTTHRTLAELAGAAVAAGSDVLVEKPGAASSEEARELAAAAKAAGRIVKVGFNHRFHPAIMRAVDEAGSGRHGEIMFVRGRYGHGGRLGYEREWRARRELSGGGQLLDQGMHLLDLSYWLLGPLPLYSALVRTQFWEMDVEDNALVVLADAGDRQGAWASLHASWTEWKNEFALEIYCRTAKLQVSGLWGSYGRQRLVIYRMKPELGPPDAEVIEYGEDDVTWEAEWANFHAAVLGRSPAGLLGDLESAAYALARVEEAYRVSGYAE